MNLYEINNELEILMVQAVDPETGEIDEDLYQKLEDLQLARDEKIRNIGCLIKNLEADVEGHKAEAQKQYAKARSCQSKAEWLRAYLYGFLEGEKFSSPEVSISYRKSQKVECEDESLVPEQYLRISTELDKSAIKKALKEGILISGCYLKDSESMQVK